MKPTHFSQLPTEQNNKKTRNIDRVSPLQILKLINQEDAIVHKKVADQLPAINHAVQMVIASLKRGGKLVFIGAGTSGRLGILEAAECPPTFNTPPSMIKAFMAGGRASVFRSKEGAEDRADHARKLMKNEIRPSDIVIGIAASGVTPFVREGLQTAKKMGAQTILITCHSGKINTNGHHIIAINTGPEVIAGSTRLKAATATKLVLNSITVATMIQLGKVYGNRMVDLQPKSNKLKARAIGLISTLGHSSLKDAETWLKKSGNKTKTAILMAKKKISRPAAQRLLKTHHGRLHLALQAPHS